MNTIGNTFGAWLPLFVWKTTDAPRYLIGYNWTIALDVGELRKTIESFSAHGRNSSRNIASPSLPAYRLARDWRRQCALVALGKPAPDTTNLASLHVACHASDPSSYYYFFVLSTAGSQGHFIATISAYLSTKSSVTNNTWQRAELRPDHHQVPPKLCAHLSVAPVEMSNQIASPVVDATGKTRLRATLERARSGGDASIGQWLEFPGYTLARTVAPLGADWVLIDTEHGNICDHDMYLQVGAISCAGVSPIVRLAGSEPWMIKRALDSGAHAIMVPMCETVEQAQAIVQASKYPSARWPKGIRGAGAMFGPAAFNQNGREYLLSANENVMTGLTCSSSAQTISASSMGYVAFDHASEPEVQRATARVLKAGLDAGKYVGHFALSADAAAAKVEDGFHFVNCGADIVAITAWMTNEMSKFRDMVGKGKDKSNGTKSDIGYS
ncbi:hypothetical protein NQ176_g11008 [Zarea fungicola]|uniref:Uncharacterized protein n=1 Tax=Zarea fungicola TaxID=93591 RepID=A0ACC1MEE6_9HYPO|nr:hypothetical protein NQ176_g11008 [Lecanicillium fungicola]